MSRDLHHPARPLPACKSSLPPRQVTATRAGTTTASRCAPLAIAISISVLAAVARAAAPDAAATRPDPPIQGGAPAAEQPADSYLPPVLTAIVLPRYPTTHLRRGEEGWVRLRFMVSPEGRPYEITVTDSLRGVAFERAAVKSVEGWQFKPATYGGQPIDAGATQTVTFELAGGDKGARGWFVRTFNAIQEQFDTLSRATLRERIDDLHPTNLYEDAYKAMMEYQFAARFGSSVDQLRWLERALVREKPSDIAQREFLPEDGVIRMSRPKGTIRRQFLPDELMIRLYRATLALQLQDNLFGAARETLKSMRELPLDGALMSEIERVEGVLGALERDPSAFAVSGAIDNASSWYHLLLKDRFTIDVTRGAVAEFKLRCERDYVGVRFDPNLEYTVAPGAGDCDIQVIGDPGTQLTLTELGPGTPAP